MRQSLRLNLRSGTLALAAGLLLFVSAPFSSSRTEAPRVEVVQTSADLSQHLTRLADLQFRASTPRGLPVIHVDDRIRYQRVNAIGAAMTDASAWLLYDRLSSSRRAAVMNDLFGRAGLHLGFLRLPIGASDFTKHRTPYSYDDLPPGRTDPHLAGFSLAHDQAYIIPALRAALALNPQLKILAEPWSPPGWMKTNGSLDNRANAGILLGSAYAPFARYFVKFIQGYGRLGVPIAAITPQNEPTNPTRYPGLDLDSGGEAKLITFFLRQALHRAGLHIPIYGGDVGWDAQAVRNTSVIDGHTVVLQNGRDYVNTLITDAGTKVLSGISWHCYFGSPDVMTALHRAAPRLDQIVDECSPGIMPFSVPELMIASLRSWASTVALWNLALDPHGGPVQPPNRGCPSCTGVLTVDPRTGAVSFKPAYYQLGQLSSFIQPGARRLASDHFVSYTYPGAGIDVASQGLDDVALRNPDGSTVLLVNNNSNRKLGFAVQWHGLSFRYALAPQATTTFVWDRPT